MASSNPIGGKKSPDIIVKRLRIRFFFALSPDLSTLIFSNNHNFRFQNHALSFSALLNKPDKSSKTPTSSRCLFPC